MEMVLLIVYLVLGYWAVGETVWANKVIYGTESKIFSYRVTIAFVCGWVLIPIAILKKMFFS